MNKINYRILNDIVRCIHEFVEFDSRAFEHLSLFTDINRDLGVEGDDANELMPEFFTRFAINLEGYDPYRYFVPEGYDLLAFRRSKDRRGKIPIRLGMLYEAAEEKIWNAPELEHANYSAAPLYENTAAVPLTGYEVRGRPD